MVKNYKSSLLIILLIFSLLTPFLNLNVLGQDLEKIITKESDEIYLLKDIEINTQQKTVILPCTVNMTSGLLEVILCRPEGKTHESLFKTNVTPLEFQTALLLLGLDPVNELPENESEEDPLSPYKTIETPGDSIRIFLEFEKEGKTERMPVEHFIRDERTQKAVTNCSWLFRGATTHKSGIVFIEPDLTMVATYHDPLALIELNNPDKWDDELFYVNTNAGLSENQPVKLIFQLISK